MTPVIETGSLTKRYGRKTALSDCTMSIPAGHVVGLVGPNGAGMFGSRGVVPLLVSA